MIQGTVKVWDSIKGWGFIEDDDGYDFFLHVEQIRKGQKLRVGDRVNFDVSETQRGPTAENVSKVTGR